MNHENNYIKFELENKNSYPNHTFFMGLIKFYDHNPKTNHIYIFYPPKIITLSCQKMLIKKIKFFQNIFNCTQELVCGPYVYFVPVAKTKKIRGGTLLTEKTSDRYLLKYVRYPYLCTLLSRQSKKTADHQKKLPISIY